MHRIFTFIAIIAAVAFSTVAAAQSVTNTVVLDSGRKIEFLDNGDRRITEPDGSVRLISTKGYEQVTDSDGNLVTTFDDGTIVRQNVGGSVHIVRPDGSWSTQDGETRTHGYPDGTTVQFSPDGTKTTFNTDGSTKTVAPDGTITSTPPLLGGGGGSTGDSGGDGGGSTGSGDTSEGGDSSGDKPDVPPTDANTLQPGAGFIGMIAPPGPVGDPNDPGYDAKAIARWDVVPNQTVTPGQPFALGVIAFHRSGIHRVEFSVNNGPWTKVYHPTFNQRTQVEEYWAYLDASLFAGDGVAEVRAIVYPNHGIPRVLQGPIAYDNDYQNSQWTGEHSMFFNIDKNGINSETIIELPSGSYAWGEIPGAPGSYPTDRWLVIRPAPGAEVTITPGLWHPQPNMIRLQNVTVSQPTQTAPLRGSADNVLWLDGVSYVGPGMWSRTDGLKTMHAFWTNSSVSQSQFGHAMQFIRNCDFTAIGEDTIKAAYLVVNTTVDNQGTPPAELTWHPAVIANPIAHDNRIYYGLDITSRQKAFAFRNGTWDYWEHIDVAIVNCRAEKTTSGNQLVYIGGTVKHMIVRGSEFIGGSFNFRLSDSLPNPDWRFNPNDVVIEDNNFFDDPTWEPNPTPYPGVDFIPQGATEPVR